MILRAKYVILNSRTVIENGAVAIQGSKIVDIGLYPTVRSSGHTPDTRPRRSGAHPRIGECTYPP